MLPNRYDKPKDTAEPIFTKLFTCRYPVIYSKSEDEIKACGLYSTGDKKMDKDIIGSQLTTGMLTINRMVELYKINCPIYICKREDTICIYELICDHLHAWMDRLDYGVNIGNAPIEDLILLDEFAEHIFTYVRHEYKRNNVQDDLHNKIRNLAPYNTFNILKKPLRKKLLEEGAVEETDIVEINKKEEDDLPTRMSLAEMLKTSLMNLRN